MNPYDDRLINKSDEETGLNLFMKVVMIGLIFVGWALIALVVQVEMIDKQPRINPAPGVDFSYNRDAWRK